MTGKGGMVQVYNNEVLCAVLIDKHLQIVKEETITKLMVFIPIVTNDRIINSITRSRSVDSLEKLILRFPDSVANFSERYYELLPNTIKSLNLLLEIENIEIIEDKVVHTNYEESEIPNLRNKFGKRITRIDNKMDCIIKILNCDATTLYRELRILL